MLADPGCCHQDPLGVPFGPPCPGGIGCDLLPQRCLEHGDSEFFLAEQGQLAAVLKFEEVRQPARPDALSAGCLQRQAVDAGEPRRVVSEHCAGQDVPPAPCEREPSRFAIFASTLDGGRENSRASTAQAPGRDALWYRRTGGD